jgi:hypothetical protein
VETIAAMIVAATVVRVVTVRILAAAEVVSGVAAGVVAAADATSAKAAGAICLLPNTLRRRAVNAETIAVRIVVMTVVLIVAVTAEAIVAMIAAVAGTPIAADLKIVARAVTLTVIAARIPHVLLIRAKKPSCFPANP